MGIYLVDYENVHNDGVTDIQKLSASDRVVIFYGDSIKSIPFETHVEMMASKAAIEYIETHKVAKNYLDFQLATYLGFLIGKGEKGPVYIISQDTGFDSIVDFWRGRIKKRDERGKRDKRNCGKKEAGKEKTSGSDPQKNTNGIKRRKTSGRQIHIHL